MKLRLLSSSIAALLIIGCHSMANAQPVKFSTDGVKLSGRYNLPTTCELSPTIVDFGEIGMSESETIHKTKNMNFTCKNIVAGSKIGLEIPSGSGYTSTHSLTQHRIKVGASKYSFMVGVRFLPSNRFMIYEETVAQNTATKSFSVPIDFLLRLPEERSRENLNEALLNANNQSMNVDYTIPVSIVLNPPA